MPSFSRPELLAHEDVAGEVESELAAIHGSDDEDDQRRRASTRQRSHGRLGASDAPARRVAATVEPERDEHAERRDRVHPARVEVVLVDEPRNRRAQRDRGRRRPTTPRGGSAAIGDEDERDRDERDREVHERERCD